MKILFLVHWTPRTRHFTSVVQRLAERGHTVTIAALPRKGEIKRPEGVDHPNISIVRCPNRRVDGWRSLIGPLRLARDYVRYFDPRFAEAKRLKRRADRLMGNEIPHFKRLFDDHAWARRGWRLIGRALQTIEDVIPSDEAFETFLRSERPDVVLMTPLIAFGSHQTDYVKAARRLGLPSALLPFSWDNLTNRGHMRVLPDRVLVWNDVQRREAIDLHGVPPERVGVTGAPRFDEFFAMRPTMTRDEFCAQIGLDPAQPYILYLCSDNFVAKHREVEFVREWVGQIRRSPDPALQTCGILVRPHPRFPAEWQEADLSDLPGVVIAGSRKMNADPTLYEALYHSATAFALSTSAMIEAGVLGKAVHTLLVPEFEGQEGVLHFDYLLRAHGGLVAPVRDFDELRRNIAASLAAAGSPNERSRRFLEGFVRPYGVDVPATPIMVREIEQLAGLHPPRRRIPLWHYPARPVLQALARRWLVPAMTGRPVGRRAGAPAAPVSPGVNGAAAKPKAPKPRPAAVSVADEYLEP